MPMDVAFSHCISWYQILGILWPRAVSATMMFLWDNWDNHGSSSAA